MTRYIPPDYEKDDEEDDITLTDEGKEENLLDGIMQDNTTSPNSTTPPFSIPRWGQPQQPQPNSPPWQKPPFQGNNSWGQPNSIGGTQWNSGGWRPQPTNREVLNRGKKVIFIDFLDCIVETFQSNQTPGYLPRDIYDLTPKFNVWQKLAALNPEKIYILIPRNLLPTTNGAPGWEATLTYYCCSLSSFIRIPYTACQVLVQSVIGQSKESIMLSVIDDSEKPIDRSTILSIGINSGLNSQSDVDKRSAEICGVDYVDLYQLLNMV
jgi:hypothetical protein